MEESKSEAPELGEGGWGWIHIFKMWDQTEWHPVGHHHLQLISNDCLNLWLLFNEQQYYEILEAGGESEHLLEANIYQYIYIFCGDFMLT